MKGKPDGSVHVTVLCGSIEVRPSVSDDLCEFMWSCGGYHSRDIMKRKTPKSWNIMRMVSILLVLL